MGKKKAPAPIHSKKPNHQGRTKDRRHGTREWVSWVPENRVDPAFSFRHSGKKPS